MIYIIFINLVCYLQRTTGVMAVSEIPPQMANLQTFFLKDLFSCQDFFLYTLHTAILCFQPFSPKAAYFGIDKYPKLQFIAKWSDRNLISRIDPS